MTKYTEKQKEQRRKAVANFMKTDRKSTRLNSSHP